MRSGFPRPLRASEAGRPPPEVAAAFRDFRLAFAGVGVFSAVINVLSLTGAIFMLEIYDRVLPGRSIPTLLGLIVIAGILFAMQGLLDVIRGRMLIRIGSSLDARLSDRVQQVMAEMPLKLGNRGDGQRTLRDLDQIRTFLSGGGPIAFFDLPWMPFYLLICFLFHVWIGVTALIGACLLASMAWLTEIKSRVPVLSAAQIDKKRQSLAQSIARNAEAVSAMGMRERMFQIWSGTNAEFIGEQQRAFDVTSGFGALSKVLRMALQSLILGVGAYLVILQEASAGIIVASSIITARALAPVELAISHWRAFVATRDSVLRLERTLAEVPEETKPLRLPAPVSELAVQAVGVVPPGWNRLVVDEVSFALKAGQALAIVGPSASGKTSLSRAVVGVWRPTKGRVRLDGAAIDQWSIEELGRHIGYLPQNVELFAGTVAENISRFKAKAPPEAIYAAARAAAVHDLIVRLPNGYETEIGENGEMLSAGQRQRIGLARALYDDPFLVVLDEPNAHLDQEGEQAVLFAVDGVRKRGGIVVVVAHRPGILAQVSHMLLLAAGHMVAFGPRDEVVAKHFRPTVQPGSRSAV